jgi:phage shock protein A
MSFWQRFGTTMRADAHGVIDALEDRALVLKQHVRDAELAVHEKRAKLQALERERTRLGKDRERIARERTRYDRDAELALRERQDELARHALSRLLPLEQLDTRLAERLALIADEEHALGETLAAQQNALAELQARVATFLAEQAQPAAEGAPFCPRPVEPETIEIELLRRKRALSEEPGHDPR